ncbi:MAG: helix-turn-helix domain-containing protein [Ruminococcus sp.]|nr:helix-turn-helix domain-containing protein [Ruminococcus sp.]
MFETISYSEQKAFLSVSETARLLGVSYKTILMLIYTGQIPAVKVSRRYIIKAADLIKYIQSNTK